jgi:hypothetical protein
MQLARREVLIGSVASLAFAQAAKWHADDRNRSIFVSPYPLAFVDGEVAGRKIRVLLDTGSVRRFQISDALVSSLELPDIAPGEQTSRHDSGPRRARKVIAPDTKIAGATGPSEAEVVAGDIEKIVAQTREPFDAIIGWPWFAENRMTLDFQQRMLQSGFPANTGESTPLAADNDRLPLLDLLLNGEPVRALFDTGAPTCNIDSSLSPNLGKLERHRVRIGTREFELDFRVKDLSRMRQGTGAVAVIGLNLMLGRQISIDGPGRQILIGERVR